MVAELDRNRCNRDKTPALRPAFQRFVAGVFAAEPAGVSCSL
jgi:hypothetical protein